MGLRIRRGSSAKLGIGATIIAAFALMAYPFCLATVQSVHALTPDLLPPKVEFIAPSTNGYVKGEVNFSFKITDDSGVEKAYYNILDAGGNVVSINGVKTFWMTEGDDDVWSYPSAIDTTVLANGKYTFTVRATDNSTTHNVKYYKSLGPIIVDNQNPKVTMAIETSIVNGFVKTDSFKMQGLASDNESGVDAVKIVVNRLNDDGSFRERVIDFDTATLNGNEFTYDVSSLPDGRYALKALAYDKAGNWKAAGFEVAVDTTYPVLNITSPTPGQTVGGNTLEVYGTAADDNIDYYQYYIMDGDGNTIGVSRKASVSVENGKLAVFDIKSLSTETYTIRFTAVDKAGNLVNAKKEPHMVSFAIDHTAPATSMRLTSRPTMMASTGPITLAGKVNESLRTLLLKNLRTGDEVELKDRVDSAGNWTYTIPTEKIEAGEYSFSLYAEDQYGNGRTTNLGPVMVTQYVPSNGGITPASPDSGSVTLASPNLFTTPATVPFTAVQQDDEADESEVLGAQAAKQPTQSSDLPAVAATESGWKVFGIAWYWWALIAAILAAGAWWTVASVRRRRVTELA